MMNFIENSPTFHYHRGEKKALLKPITLLQQRFLTVRTNSRASWGGRGSLFAELVYEVRHAFPLLN